MRSSSRPIHPVAPDSLELLFIYSCPHCGQRIPVSAPTQPAMLPCPACHKSFPIVPVDERGLRFIRLMTNNGRAAVDPDFL